MTTLWGLWEIQRERNEEEEEGADIWEEMTDEMLFFGLKVKNKSIVFFKMLPNKCRRRRVSSL